MYRLPEGYTPRTTNEHFIDAPTGLVYQPDAYDLARYLIERGAATRLVDIGCGNAEKLKGLDARLSVTCVDTHHMRESVSSNVPLAAFVEANLEEGVGELGPLDGAVVVCADVIEHLRQPENLLRRLAVIAKDAAFMLISTPDRVRARGLLDPGPPANPAHTMEWTAEELGRFMLDCGFDSGFLLGHTVNTNWHCTKSTILAIAGAHATYRQPSQLQSLAAIVPAYNEVDVLEEVCRHLASQGADVHVIDNWSTDGTFELAESLVASGVCHAVRRYPAAPSTQFEWGLILSEIEGYAAKLPSDWIVYCDADEVRWSSWRNVSLRDAMSAVDAMGYNAIDFTLLDFRFTQEQQHGPDVPLSMLRYFEFGRRPGHFAQVKAWKNTGRVNLADTGGHIAEFPGRRTYPLKFLTQHYPLRSAAQASRKIHFDRIPRFAKERAEKGWHTQYDWAAATSVPPWNPERLINFHRPMFDDDYLVERISGIGLRREDAVPSPSAAEQELLAMRTSTSWKITAPLRSIATRLRAAFRAR